MGALRGNHALLALLRDEGVELIFGNPGSTELGLMDALAVEHSLRYVLALQEAAVMAMAYGYSAASRRVCAVNVHAAPGLSNALGILYNCKKAGMPVLVTAGQQDTSIALTEPLLWDDLPTIARPFVKWSYEVHRLADLPRAVHRAVKVALTPPTGPVFLSIPQDVLSSSAELDLGHPTRIGLALRADPADIMRAAQLIAAARQPLIFAGDIVAQRAAHDELGGLAELIGAPVFCEAMADTASFPSSHPLFAGAVARFSPAVRNVMRKHDLVVSIGGDLFTQSLASDHDVFAPGTPIVHLDVDPWELGKNYPTQVALLGDPKATLPEITDAIRRAYAENGRSLAHERADRIATEIRTARQQRRAEAASLRADGPALDPAAALHALGSVLPEDSVVIEELLSSAAGIRDLITTDRPDSFFGLRGGGIGMAFPQAVGAKLAMPERPVIALAGDGSSLYNIQALWTAAHERAAVVFVVFNNRAYHILKQRTKALAGDSQRTGRFVGMDLDDPTIDFIAIASGFGVSGRRVHTVASLKEALDEALHSGRPFLIDVAISSR